MVGTRRLIKEKTHHNIVPDINKSSRNMDVRLKDNPTKAENYFFSLFVITELLTLSSWN